MHKKDKIGFANIQIIAIELLGINFAHQIFPEKSKFNYNISVETRIDSAEKRVIIITHVSITKEKETALAGSISVSCVYGFPEFSSIVKKINDATWDIPDALLHLLFSISISTTRGVMFEQFRGTPLHNATLPIVNTNNLMPVKM